MWNYSIHKFSPNGTQISSGSVGWGETSIDAISKAYKYVRNNKELFETKECKAGFCGCQ